MLSVKTDLMTLRLSVSRIACLLSKRSSSWRVALVTLFFASAFTLPQAQAEDKEDNKVTALLGGTVIDGTGADPVGDSVVLIQNGRILDVGPMGKVKIPRGTQRIDIKGKTVLPGFIDLHNHVMYPPGPLDSLGSTELIKKRTKHNSANVRTESLSTLRALHFMTLNMRAGITALRDTGATIESGQALMQARGLGYTNAARLYSVGNVIAMTGGHNAKFSPPKGAVGPWGFREFVRENYAAGFKHVKISPPYTREEVTAAIDEAKKLGMKVTAHAGYFPETDPPELVRMAVEAGVESLEHTGNPIRDDVLDLMAEKGVKLIPTLSIYRALMEMNSDFPLKMPELEEVVRKAHKRGIVIGVGTDFVGNWLDETTPNAYFTEMKYFMDLGMTAMEVIVAATRNGGMILGMEKDLGTLEKGKIADLQVIDGNPLKSFDVLGHPEFVMMDGEIVYRP